MESRWGLFLDFLVKKTTVKVFFVFIFNDFELNNNLLNRKSNHTRKSYKDSTILIKHCTPFLWFQMKSNKYIKIKNTENQQINSVCLDLFLGSSG